MAIKGFGCPILGDLYKRAGKGKDVPGCVVWKRRSGGRQASLKSSRLGEQRKSGSDFG